MSLIARVKSWLRVSSRGLTSSVRCRTRCGSTSSSIRRICGGGVSRKRKLAGVRSPSSAALTRARRNAATPSACGWSTSCAATSATHFGCCAGRRRSRWWRCCRSGSGSAPTPRSSALIDTVLVKTLPVDDPQRLFFVDNSGGKSGGSNGPPYPCFERLRDHNRFLSGIAAFDERMFKVSIDGVPERVRGQYASGSYFDLLGVRAVHGRMLTPADDSEPGRGGPRRRGRRDQRRLLDAPLRKGSGGAREERSGRHAVGDHRRRHTAGILRASGRRRRSTSRFP